MLRIARIVSIGGEAAAVAGLALVHARLVADPPYPFTGTSRFGWALAYLALLTLAVYAVGLPDQPRSAPQAAWVSLVAAAVAALGVWAVQLVVGDALLPRFVVFGAALATVPVQVGANALARAGQAQAGDRDRVLLVAAPAERERLVDDLGMEPERGATLVGALSPVEAAPTGDGAAPLVDAQRRSRATLVVIDRSAQADDRIIAQAAALHELGVRVRTLQDFYETWLGKLPLSELERASLFFDISEVHGTRYARVKRVLDLTVAVPGLVLLLVVLPVVAVGNLVANRGRLLFRQQRVGRDGRPFTILKFRTMSPDPDPGADGGGEWTERDDPRVTPFGRLLRRTHLDELPQVLNIVRGDLSVVGPRPEQPRYVDSRHRPATGPGSTCRSRWSEWSRLRRVPTSASTRSL